MTTLLVGVAGLAGVLSRYGLSRLTRCTARPSAYLGASVAGGIAAAAAGFVLGRKLAA